MAKKTLKQRVNSFLDTRIKVCERDLADFRSMQDRLNNTNITDEEFNSILGVLKFWLSRREDEK